MTPHSTMQRKIETQQIANHQHNYASQVLLCFSGFEMCFFGLECHQLFSKCCEFLSKEISETFVQCNEFYNITIAVINSKVQPSAVTKGHKVLCSNIYLHVMRDFYNTDSFSIFINLRAFPLEKDFIPCKALYTSVCTTKINFNHQINKTTMPLKNSTTDVSNIKAT